MSPLCLQLISWIKKADLLSLATSPNLSLKLENQKLAAHMLDSQANSPSCPSSLYPNLALDNEKLAAPMLNEQAVLLPFYSSHNQNLVLENCKLAAHELNEQAFLSPYLPQQNQDWPIQPFSSTTTFRPDPFQKQPDLNPKKSTTARQVASVCRSQTETSRPAPQNEEGSNLNLDAQNQRVRSLECMLGYLQTSLLNLQNRFI